MAASHGSEHGVEHRIQILGEILREKTQHGVTVLLQQAVLVAIPSVRLGIAQMPGAIDLDRHTRVLAQEVDLHFDHGHRKESLAWHSTGIGVGCHRGSPAGDRGTPRSHSAPCRHLRRRLAQAGQPPRTGQRAATQRRRGPADERLRHSRASTTDPPAAVRQSAIQGWRWPARRSRSLELHIPGSVVQTFGTTSGRSGQRSRTHGPHACHLTTDATARRTARSSRATRPGELQTACRAERRRIPRRRTCRYPEGRAFHRRESQRAAQRQLAALSSHLPRARPPSDRPFPTTDQRTTLGARSVPSEPTGIGLPVRRSPRRHRCCDYGRRSQRGLCRGTGIGSVCPRPRRSWAGMTSDERSQCA